VKLVCVTQGINRHQELRLLKASSVSHHSAASGNQVLSRDVLTRPYIILHLYISFYGISGFLMWLLNTISLNMCQSLALLISSDAQIFLRAASDRRWSPIPHVLILRFNAQTSVCFISYAPNSIEISPLIYLKMVGNTCMPNM
jgi:hypothetical protein